MHLLNKLFVAQRIEVKFTVIGHGHTFACGMLICGTGSQSGPSILISR